MKDVVVGCITNYDWDKIKFWANSLDNSGFTGDKVIIAYNLHYDVIKELSSRGYTVYGFGKDDETEQVFYTKPNFNICLERFFHTRIFLNNLDYRYIIATDVKDVVFQKNPSEWLEQNIGDKKIVVASESITYQDEDWGRNNMQQSFGDIIYDYVKENVIYNAGTISGDFHTMMDFFLNIFLACGNSPEHVQGGGGPDQAALNVLLNMSPYKQITKFVDSEEGWACQLGTSGNPDKFKYLTEPSPMMQDDIVTTSQGIPFTIVHQYDRIPDWKKIIEEKYS